MSGNTRAEWPDEPSRDDNHSMGKSSQQSPETKENEELALVDIPAKVERIHFTGLTRTKDDILTKQVKDVFTATNFQEVVLKAQNARVQMERLGLFKKIKIFIDTSKGSEAQPNGYEVHYIVKESRRVGGGISTLVGTNDGSLLFSLKLPNMFGRGEKTTVEYTYGTKAAVGYAANFVKPLAGNPDIRLSVGGFRYSGEYPWSGYREIDRGTAVELSVPSIFGSHNLRWEGVWRELGCLTNTTAFAVRQQAGHSLKSSVKHTWLRERLDDRIVPTNGYSIRVAQELAGLGGDANFMKHDVEVQLSKGLPLGSSLQVSFAGGLIKSLKPEADLRINDRFFLGGPLTLRGFNLKGVGPHEEGNALGADTYWLSGVHLYTPLPFQPGKGGFGDLFRTHAFFTAGNLRNINMSDDWRENLSKLADTLRMSYGAGIVLKMGGVARMELNYVVPLRVQKGDSVCPGIQFGIGINFL